MGTFFIGATQSHSPSTSTVATLPKAGPTPSPSGTIDTTVKLGYNELGYSELSAIANKNIKLVGPGVFNGSFSRL